MLLRNLGSGTQRGHGQAGVSEGRKKKRLTGTNGYRKFWPTVSLLPVQRHGGMQPPPLILDSPRRSVGVASQAPDESTSMTTTLP